MRSLEIEADTEWLIEVSVLAEQADGRIGLTPRLRRLERSRIDSGDQQSAMWVARMYRL
jgi:hypothetical protein